MNRGDMTTDQEKEAETVILKTSKSKFSVLYLDYCTSIYIDGQNSEDGHQFVYLGNVVFAGGQKEGVKDS